MNYDEIIDEVTKRVEKIAQAPIHSGVPYVLTFKEALRLFLEDLEEDILFSRGAIVPAVKKDEVELKEDLDTYKSGWYE